MSVQSSTKSGIAAAIKSFLWPLLAIAVFALRHSYHWSPLLLLAVVLIIVVVLNAVHHAEVIAHKVGEPFGTVVLALAVTTIEASIIISLMLSGESDTIFAAVMIILTGMTGLTLLIGGLKFREVQFGSDGVVSVLTVLVAISTLTLILPNFSVAMPGPYYSVSQLAFVAVITLLLYGSFLFVQNFRHRKDYVGDEESTAPAEVPGRRAVTTSAILLPLNLVAVVLLAESMAPDLEAFIHSIGAPASLSGIVIACVILLPEGISAIKAAAKNQMQRSLNLSLGSALASISLTIPVVAFFAIYRGVPLALGINKEFTVLFLLALFVIILSLSKGKTTILQGIVLLLLFVVYLFISVNP
jgi:Ca2+:H+ antiporter